MITDTSTTAEPMIETGAEEDEDRLVGVFKNDIEFLREIPMFANLEDVDLARLCQVAHVRRYPAGAILLEEGQMNDSLCMIRKGSVELIHRRNHGVPFLKLGRGRFFGQVSMFDPAPSSATVQAVTNVEVMCLKERPLCDLLIAYPEIGLRLMAAVVRDLAKRYHTLVRRVHDLDVEVGGLAHHQQ
jgi:CRP/FNR family cyclic AMP-dependent transcriptional regulator